MSFWTLRSAVSTLPFRFNIGRLTRSLKVLVTYARLKMQRHTCFKDWIQVYTCTHLSAINKRAVHPKHDKIVYLPYLELMKKYLMNFFWTSWTKCGAWSTVSTYHCRIIFTHCASRIWWILSEQFEQNVVLSPQSLHVTCASSSHTTQLASDGRAAPSTKTLTVAGFKLCHWLATFSFLN